MMAEAAGLVVAEGLVASAEAAVVVAEQVVAGNYINNNLLIISYLFWYQAFRTIIKLRLVFYGYTVSFCFCKLFRESTLLFKLSNLSTSVSLMVGFG